MNHITKRVASIPALLCHQYGSTVIVKCPYCHVRLSLEDLQPGAHLFDPVLSALVDHLDFIETELAAVRRLVEEVLP